MALSVMAVSISVSPFLTLDAADRHVHHVRPEPLARELERRLGAGRGLEEQVDLGAPAQGRALLLDLARNRHRLVGEIEQRLDLQARQMLDAEQVALGEDGRRRGDHRSRAISEPKRETGFDLSKPPGEPNKSTAQPSKSKQNCLDLLGFIRPKSGLFNGLQPFQIKNSSLVSGSAPSVSKAIFLSLSPYLLCPAAWQGAGSIRRLGNV